MSRIEITEEQIGGGIYDISAIKESPVLLRDCGYGLHKEVSISNPETIGRPTSKSQSPASNPKAS